MQMIAAVAVPFFAVLLCGFLARQFHIVGEAGVRGLNSFVFWFALPALLFWKVAETPFERLSDPRFYAVYEGSCLILYCLTFIVMQLVLHRSRSESAIAALAASWGNVGYMGVPLLLAAYRADQVLPAVLATALDSIVMQTLTVALIESGSASRKIGPLGLCHALLTNPLILAVILGFFAAALHLQLPTMLKGFLAILGPAAGPGALFALGATLTIAATPSRDYALATGLIAAKLVLLPALTYATLHLVALPPLLVEPTLVTAALPTAASVFVLAQRYTTLERTIALIVFASHLAGIATLTALLLLLQHT